MSNPEGEHIGDGCYASWDGFQIILRTERHGKIHWIALEPETFAALVSYNERKPWVLSEHDSKAFVQAIIDPPEPNDALKAAAEDYRKRKD